MFGNTQIVFFFSSWQVFDLTYAALFSIELILKIWVDGRSFFCEGDRGLLLWSNILQSSVIVHFSTSTFLTSFEFGWCLSKTCQQTLMAGTPTPSLFWNYLDLTIVCTSLVEVIFDILLLVQADGSDTRIAPTNLLRVIRIVRVLRVMRVIKVLGVGVESQWTTSDEDRRSTVEVTWAAFKTPVGWVI